MRVQETDVLVIGSGFGAAAPALRLARAGWHVTVLEKGPALDAVSDFRRTQDPEYFRTYLKSAGDRSLRLTYAEALGGGSGFYEMISLRAPSLAFEQRDENGRSLWPAGLDRKALDPYYAKAEEMLHVQQIARHEIPRTGLVFSLLLRNLGYTCERAPYAVDGCVGSGYCVAGCSFGAKQSLLVNYLPDARDAGAEILTGLEAESIRALAVASSPADAVEPFRYETICRPRDARQQPVAFRSRLVVVAAGTVGSARLLLRSRGGLPRLSGEVGRHVCFNGSVRTAALLAPSFPDGDMYTGRSHPGLVSFQFLESHGLMVTAAKALPLFAVTAARFRLQGESADSAAFGTSNLERMRQFRKRTMVLVAFGFTPPSARVELDRREGVRVSLETTESLRRYYERTRSLLHSIFRRNGCKVLEVEFLDEHGSPYPEPHFSSAHPLGSCRMADGPGRGVVDADGQVFGYPGLYVSDGSVIPSSLAVNTSLTILANAERIAEKIVSRLHARGGRLADWRRRRGFAASAALDRGSG